MGIKTKEIQLGGTCLFCGVHHGEKHKFNCNMLTDKEVEKICQPSPVRYGGACPFCGAINGTEHKSNCPEVLRKIAFEREEKEQQQQNQNPLSKQIGGSHYKNFPIQPLEFITKNNLSFTQGNVIKRICRYNLPGGKGKEDLLKIIHEIQCLIEMGF